MPEFILDMGSSQDARTFQGLDGFTRGYVEALFFTDASSSDDGDLQDATFGELSPAALESIEADCQRFQQENAADIAAAIEHGGRKGEYDEEAAGRDFWYTRNGHGVGYFDRGLGDIGDHLQAAAGKWRELDLYRGDDGMVYFE